MERPPVGYFYNAECEVERLPRQQPSESREQYLERCLTCVIDVTCDLADALERSTRSAKALEFTLQQRQAAELAWKVVQLTAKWPTTTEGKRALKARLHRTLQGLLGSGAPRITPAQSRALLKAMTPPATGKRAGPLQLAKVAYNAVMETERDGHSRAVRGPLRRLLLDTKPSSVTA